MYRYMHLRDDNFPFAINAVDIGERLVGSGRKQLPD